MLNNCFLLPDCSCDSNPMKVRGVAGEGCIRVKLQDFPAPVSASVSDSPIYYGWWGHNLKILAKTSCLPTPHPP